MAKSFFTKAQEFISENPHKFLLPLAMGAVARSCSSNALWHYHYTLPLSAILMWDKVVSLSSTAAFGAAIAINPVEQCKKGNYKPVIKEAAKACAAWLTSNMMNNSRFDPILSFVAGVGAAAAVEYGAQRL